MTTLALLAFSQLAQAAPALPEDPRLEPVRARVEEMVTRAEQGGLPAEIIVSKVREGLAKGVDPQRIVTAAQRLSEGLAEARGFVAERRPQGAPAPELIRAVAESRMAGVDPSANDELVRKGRTAGESARAVEVLTDLSRRGYPVDHAAKVVRDVLAKDPGSVPKLAATLETIRNEHALTQGESIDALSRGMAKGGGSLQSAAAHAAKADRRAEGVGRGKAEGGAGPGNAGFVPPGQLKKEADAMKPGRGQGRK
ncbi:MAG TPA: hypothetical protein VGG33_03540 [Polyangia bacterium]